MTEKADLDLRHICFEGKPAAAPPGAMPTLVVGMPARTLARECARLQALQHRL